MEITLSEMSIFKINGKQVVFMDEDSARIIKKWYDMILERYIEMSDKDSMVYDKLVKFLDSGGD